MQGNSSNTKIAFIDSGIGGLIFAIDSIKKMDKISKNNNANHTLNFIHIGDTKNVPYGLKTPQQLIGFIEDLIEKCKNLGVKIIVIACNTASTVLDENFINRYKKQGLEIIEIIKKSAEALYNATPIIENEKHILVLGTKQTISSNKYYEALFNCHKANYKLIVHQYSPSRWEHEVENGIKKSEIQTIVNEDLGKIRNEIGKNFEKISSVGLFCTHYPYFSEEIHQNLSLYTNIGTNIKLISQGEIFAQEVLNFFNESVKINARIESYITGENLAPIQSAISNIHGNFPVIFDKI